LASALGKIARTAETVHNQDAERNPATAHLFIINPLSGERMDNLFSTHPNTENRIAALRRIEAEFRDGRSGPGMPETATPERPASRQPAQPQRLAPSPVPEASDPGSGPWRERTPQPPRRPDPEPDAGNPWGR